MLVDMYEKTIELVSDVLVNYYYKKWMLINRVSVSKTPRVRDNAPSQLLREMKKLGDDKVVTELLQSLWLQRI